jgi:putative transcriptional regulator
MSHGPVTLHRSAGMLLVFAALLLPATLLHAARTTDEPTPGPQSLAGQVLVASTAMGDPRFRRTVVLMVKHNRDAAFGIVINRPLGERPIARVLGVLGESDSGVDGDVMIFEGGPVQRDVGFIVHSADYHRDGTIDVDRRIAVTSSADVLRDIGEHKGPKQYLVAFGYAGWGAGQLDDEVKLGAWFTAPADPAIVFDEEREKVWDKAMAHRQRDL